MAGWPVRNIRRILSIDGPPQVIPDVKGNYSGGRLKPYLSTLTEHLNLQAAQWSKILLAVAFWYTSVDMVAASKGYDLSLGGWVLQIVLRDLLLIVSVGGAWDWLLRLSPWAKALVPYKFNSVLPSSEQMRRDMFWTGSATIFVSIQEVVLMHWWASGRFTRALFGNAPVGEVSVPWGEENPFFGTVDGALLSFPEIPLLGVLHLNWCTLGFMAWVMTVQYWRSAHFFIVHRAIHPWWDRDNTLAQGDIGAVLYRYVHSHHHKSYNPTAWSGLSMYPIESTLYLSACLVPLLFRSGCHPIIVLYAKIVLIVDAQLGHDGYDQPGKGTYFHQLHHAHFECNYGTQAVPLDLACGSFEDGTSYARSYTTGHKLQELPDHADADGRIALSSRVLSMEEVATHNTKQDCWIVLSGLVLDVTDFLAEHPGGEKTLLAKGGTDATRVFDAIHRKSGGMKLVKERVPNAQIGVVLSSPKDKDASGLGKTASDAVLAVESAAENFLIDISAQVVLNLVFVVVCASSWAVIMGAVW